MEGPQYLSKYAFDWEMIDVLIGGVSAMDNDYFLRPMFNKDDVTSFLKGYGMNIEDPITHAELYGVFQESIQFIKRYFLREGDPYIGLDLTIPRSLFMLHDVRELFLMATGNSGAHNEEDRLWAEAILKIMHTIIHIDKDPRGNYFAVIQTIIFDKIYKNLFRDEEDKLYLGEKGKEDAVPLYDFVTKSKKSRDSTIIKLLHKAENVAEEIYDRVGIRFITHNRFDILNVIKYLLQNNIIIPHNVIPKRSLNSIVDLKKFKPLYQQIVKESFENHYDEKTFQQKVGLSLDECLLLGIQEADDYRNIHTKVGYRSIQFTYRQLVSYPNPFIKQFIQVRELARSQDSELARKILGLDTSSLDNEVRFFYPFEVQIVDKQSYDSNNDGMASHRLYKRSQKKMALKRVFRKLIEYKNLTVV